MASLLHRIGCATACLCCLAAHASPADDLPRPKKGEPFSAFGYQAPYEEVLDHCDVALVGRVTTFTPAQQREMYGAMQRIPGRIDLAVTKVLRGECIEKRVAIQFGGKGPWGIEPDETPRAFLCLRTDDRGLILAGDPPEGGGFVREGPEHLEKLIQAAKDPEKGYRSDDPVVTLSSA
jgi:hypothetical protein